MCSVGWGEGMDWREGKIEKASGDLDSKIESNIKTFSKVKSAKSNSTLNLMHFQSVEFRQPLFRVNVNVRFFFFIFFFIPVTVVGFCVIKLCSFNVNYQNF